MIYRYMSRFSVTAYIASTFLYAGVAHSETCADTNKEAQEKEAAGHLSEASELYQQCAKQSCGAFLLNECTAHHARLVLDIPSVVPVFNDKSGTPLQDVKVTMDGESLTSRLDGRALPVDPGFHEFVFTSEDGISVTKKLMILQGQHNRPVMVSLKSPAGKPAPVAQTGDYAPASGERTDTTAPPEPKQQGSRSVPAISWVLGGVSALGGAGYVVFSRWGKKDNDMLRQCAPACQQSSVDHVKQRYLVADVSLGVGIAALSGAILAYALNKPSKEVSPDQQAYRVVVHPTTAGAVASFSGAF
jgi:hypothetical protein